MLRFLVALAASLSFVPLAVSACGDDDIPVCTPGRHRLCACPPNDQATGVEECLPDGSGFGACDCSKCGLGSRQNTCDLAAGSVCCNWTCGICSDGEIDTCVALCCEQDEEYRDEYACNPAWE